MLAIFVRVVARSMPFVIFLPTELGQSLGFPPVLHGMPKPKHYKNFQNLIQSTSTSQRVAQPLSTESTPSHFDNTLHLTSFIQPTARPTPLGQVEANLILSDETTPQQDKAFLQAFGILATDCSIFPIHFEKWPDLPVTIFNRYYDRFIKIAETGQKPGRGQLYLATHRNEDGSYINDVAKEICEKIKLALSQSTVDESEILPNNTFGKVLGKEHSEKVRCLGLGVVPGRAFRQTRPRYSDLNASSYNNGSCSSQYQEKYNQMLNAHNQSQKNYREMMNVHTQMMNAFKAYMIMKEGRIPEEFTGIFVSPPYSTPSNAASGSISPMDVRRSSGESNLNDNH
nr:uncharacterized protein LOC104093940 [Nicotiana tomentosiformis]